MKKFKTLLFTSLFVLSLAYAAFASEPKDMELTELNKKFIIHTTYGEVNGYMYPSNGLIVDTSEGLILVDTSWTDTQTEDLIYIVQKRLKKNIKMAILTHAHNDRLGGIKTLANMNIKIMITDLTAQLAEKGGFMKVEPSIHSDITPLTVGDTRLEIYYPGKGHSADNIVVYFPDAKILFGGCFIKPENAKDMGNVADAYVKEWPVSLNNLLKRYPDIQTVIPGHGEWGDVKLITHTLELLKK